MDLTQLRYFLKVAELRSFTKAAEALHIAQPAVTRQMRLLEGELGVQLLHRHSKGAEPTEAGMRLQAGAQAMLQLVSETRARVIASASEVVGRLRVGFPPSLASALMGQTIAAFHRRNPAVQLHLEEGYSQPLREQLLADGLDAAIVTDQIAPPALDLQPLFEERMWVVFAPKFAASFPLREADLSSIVKHPLIQPSSRSVMNDLLAERARAQRRELRFGVDSESLPVIRRLVQEGLGVHVSPYSSLASEIETGLLEGRPLKGMSVSRSVLTRQDRPRTLALTVFLRTLVEAAHDVASRSKGMIRVSPQGIKKRGRAER